MKVSSKLSSLLLSLLSLWSTTAFQASPRRAPRVAEVSSSRRPIQTLSLVTSGDSFKTPLTRLAAQQVDGSESDPGSQRLRSRVVATGAWVTLLAFNFLGPGNFADPADMALVQQFLDQPLDPAVNPLFVTVFSMFTTMPILLACLTMPQASKDGLPPAPFLLIASLLGYFVYGPYLIWRQEPRLQGVTRADLGWVTRHVLESKLFSYVTLAATCGSILLPLGKAVAVGLEDPTALVEGFTQLVSTSKFVGASSLDITILYLTCVALTPGDYRLRNPEATDTQARQVAALSALFPFIGSAFYLAWRPELPVE
jgi:hypothetical protein